MRVGSLFAGIGGFDLGFERCGMQTVWQVEQNPYCLAVLEKNFPQAQRFEDVRDVGAHNLEPVDLICGGFPCQDISLAGRGAGIDGARSGLWADFARIIGELGPRYAVVENVPALASRGLDRVLRDLAALGYDAEWDCLPASAFGAPHQRDRFWLVAYPNGDGVRLSAERDQREGWEVRAALGGYALAPHDGPSRPLANADGSGRRQRRGAESTRPQQPSAEYSCEAMADAARDAKARSAAQAGAGRQRAGAGGQRSPERDAADTSGDGRRARGPGRLAGASEDGQALPAEGMADPEGEPERAGLREDGPGGKRGRRLGDGRSAGGASADADSEQHEGTSHEVGGPSGAELRHDWSVEPNVGRVADGVPSRVDRLAALGNALVPQIAEWIGWRILEYEQH